MMKFIPACGSAFYRLKNSECYHIITPIILDTHHAWSSNLIVLFTSFLPEHSFWCHPSSTFFLHSFSCGPCMYSTLFWHGSCLLATYFVRYLSVGSCPLKTPKTFDPWSTTYSVLLWTTIQAYVHNVLPFFLFRTGLRIGKPVCTLSTGWVMEDPVIE